MDCVHHWKIETPNGAGSAGSWSAGSCIRCGESRHPQLIAGLVYIIPAHTRHTPGSACAASSPADGVSV